MPGNTFGESLKLTSFGESHGAAMGGILDGFPAGVSIDLQKVQHQLNRRKPGTMEIVSQRRETDQIELLSGIFEGKTLGTPIAFLVRNRDSRPEDYENISRVFRPSHADYVYQKKYGHYDYRGGGRASARETLVRTAAGAFARIFLEMKNIRISAYTLQIGPCKIPSQTVFWDEKMVDSFPVRCPDQKTSQQMVEYLKQLQHEDDSTGGIVECRITGCPPGLGEPVFDKINADLAKAMMSINAAKGFETGSGFKAATMKGSQHNDPFVVENNEVKTLTNNSGGIQGGISNGNDILFRVAFKPPASILKKQQTIDKQGNKTNLEIKGRHDPCVAPRAVPVVEAMAALVIADHWLLNLKYRLSE